MRPWLASVWISLYTVQMRSCPCIGMESSLCLIKRPLSHKSSCSQYRTNGMEGLFVIIAHAAHPTILYLTSRIYQPKSSPVLRSPYPTRTISEINIYRSCPWQHSYSTRTSQPYADGALFGAEAGLVGKVVDRGGRRFFALSRAY